MSRLRTRSIELTGYLESLLLSEIQPGALKILTPRNVADRGCQLSLLFAKENSAEVVFKKLEQQGVICDLRKPDVIRVAPAPLYNTAVDVYNFVQTLKRILAR